MGSKPDLKNGDRVAIPPVTADYVVLVKRQADAR